MELASFDRQNSSPPVSVRATLRYSVLAPDSVRVSKPLVFQQKENTFSSSRNQAGLGLCRKGKDNIKFLSEIMATYAANYLVRGLSFEVFKILPRLRVYTIYKGAITISSFLTINTRIKYCWCYSNSCLYTCFFAVFNVCICIIIS